MVRHLEYIIKPIPITKATTDKSVMTYLMNFNKPLEIVTYAWAIDGGERRILVDTGCLAEQQTASGFPSKQIQLLEEGLEKIGWNVDDIDTVILTHLHLDHFANAEKFSRSNFIIQKREYEAATHPHPAYKHLYATELIRETFKRLNVRYIDGDQKIAEGISVMVTPGHTPGGQTVLVNTAKGVAAITGFCCIRENIEPPKGLRDNFQVLVPGIHTDIVKLYESMMKVKRRAEIIIPIHDKEYLNKKEIPE